MQYSRNLIFKVLDPYKCDWRYAFILEHFHKSFDKVNKRGEKYCPRVVSPTKGVLVPSKALNRAGYLWKYCKIINSTVMPEVHKANQTICDPRSGDQPPDFQPRELSTKILRVNQQNVSNLNLTAQRCQYYKWHNWDCYFLIWAHSVSLPHECAHGEDPIEERNCLLFTQYAFFTFQESSIMK